MLLGASRAASRISLAINAATVGIPTADTAVKSSTAHAWRRSSSALGAIRRFDRQTLSGDEVAWRTLVCRRISSAAMAETLRLSSHDEALLVQQRAFRAPDFHVPVRPGVHGLPAVSAITLRRGGTNRQVHGLPQGVSAIPPVHNHGITR